MATKKSKNEYGSSKLIITEEVAEHIAKQKSSQKTRRVKHVSTPKMKAAHRKRH